MERLTSLTEGRIGRTLFHLSLPIVYANVLQTASSSINSVWVGKFLGEAALTATLTVHTVMLLLLGATFGVATIAATLIAQLLGGSYLREAKRVLGTGITLFTIISACTVAVGPVAAVPTLHLMGTPPESVTLALDYMHMFFFAVPSLYMFLFLALVLQGAGDSATPLLFTILSVAMDATLNPLLIFGVGPIPAFGIAGSALATCMGQGVSVVAMIYYLYRRDHFLCLSRADLPLFRLDWRTAGTLMRKGAPASAQVLVPALSGVLMLTLVNKLGIATASAYAVLIQLWNYVQMPAIAVAAAASSMAAQNVGAQRWDRIGSVLANGILYSSLSTTCMALLLQTLDTRAFGLFMPADSDALFIARHIHYIVTWSLVPLGVSAVLFGVVQATGAVVVPLWINVFTLLGLRYVMATLLISTCNSDFVWWSFPLSAVATLALASYYYKFGKWRAFHVMAAPRVAPNLDASHPYDRP